MEKAVRIAIMGEKAIMVSGYWLKPLIVTVTTS
jgi:hypothetical protein